MENMNLQEHLITNSFRYFCQLGIQQKLGRMHDEWIDLAENSPKNLCIMSARGHFKTSILSVAYPLWLAYKSPKPLKIVTMSGTLRQSGEIMSLIKDKIDQTPFLTEKLLPNNLHSTTWNESLIRTKNGHRFYSITFGDTIRGIHPQVCICDDVLRVEEQTNVQTSKDTFWGAVYPTLHANKGKAIVVGTPTAYTDLLHELATKPSFQFRKYPALILDSSGQNPVAQFPEHYSIEQLQDMKLDMPSDKWAREYMCEPLSGETSMFPYEVIKKSVELHRQLEISIRPPPGKEEPAPPLRYMACDIAVSENVQADWSVFTVLEKREGMPLYMKDMVRKHLNTNQNVMEIISLQKKYGCAKVLVEYTGVGTGVSQELQSVRSPIRGAIIPFDTKKKSREKILGNLEVSLRNGELAILDNDILIAELSKFAYKESKDGSMSYESLGKHDDTVLSLALALECANVSRPVSLQIV